MIIEDITPYNNKGQRHGYWEWYFFNNLLTFKGNYFNGNKIGYWENNWSNGKIYRKIYYLL